MHKKTTIKFLTPVAACLAALVMLAAPAVAASSPYNVEAQRMRITVGSQNFDTPSGSPVLCPGTTGITGTIDDTAGTINGTLGITSSEFDLFGSKYQLTATGTSNTGAYNASAKTFNSLTFSSISFTIKSINTGTCTPIKAVCSGTASLTASGGLIGTASPPLSTGDELYVNATGSITSVTSCSFPWNLVISKGTSLSIGQNPAYPSDPGAVFEQL